MSASTLPEVYFARQATPTPAQHEPSRAEVAQFCQSLATNPSIAVVQSILDTYKGTPIAACAQARLDELKRGKIASPEPQRPAPPAATAPPPPRPSAPPSSGNAWMDALRTWLDGSGPALPPYRDAKPNPITSAPLELKVQSSFARTLDVLGTLVHSLSSEVESVSGGKIKLNVHEPGAIVSGIEVHHGVAQRKVEAAWTSAGYFAGTDAGFAGLDGTLPFGLPPHKAVAWIEGEGGTVKDQLHRKHGLKSLTCGMAGPEGVGWFRRPVNSIEDLKGLKMRFFGLGAAVMQKVGVSTQLMTAADIVPSLERGTIDATEFSTPYHDVKVGFHRVVKYYYYPAWHQPSALIDLIVNLALWDGLSSAQRQAIEIACKRVFHRSVEAIRGDQKAGLQALAKEGITPLVLPGPVLDALEKATREVLAQEAARSSSFKMVLDSYARYR
jgi:TRAP-type mannitol/chloroaromatic compound transport system substrate-binding protein